MYTYACTLTHENEILDRTILGHHRVGQVKGERPEVVTIASVTGRTLTVYGSATLV